MRPVVRLGAAFAALAVLAGCIDTNVTVTVKTDGSGTIERTIVVSDQLVELMMGMGMGGSDMESVQKELLDPADLEGEAQTMGEGVTFVSSEPLTTETGKGYRALYRFTDITKVRVDQSPSGGVNLPESPNEENAPAGPELVTFGFTRGTPATLTIRPPRPAGSTTPQPEVAEQAAAEGADEMMEMFRGLYADMRVVVNVVVQGTIARTNAQYVDGAKVTLMDLDFGKILEDDEMFKKLASGDMRSLTGVEATLKAIPGVKIETQESVTVTFR